MKVPALLKSRWFMVFVAAIVIIVLLRRRDGYTYKLGSGAQAPSDFWSDPKRITVVTSNGVFMTNENHKVLPIKAIKRLYKPFTHCYANVALGTQTCFKYPLK